MDLQLDVPGLLARITLVGWGAVLAVGAIAVAFLILTVLLWRNHKVWRWVTAVLVLVFGVGTAGAYVNNQFSYFDNAADLLGIPTYPTIDGDASGGDVKPQPNGAVTQIKVPDTASSFGAFDATVWLPPQYFTNARQHFPVVYLLHGNPGQGTDWLTSAGGAATFLAAAQSGSPAVVVMPEDLQNNLSGDSLCVDTASQGNAETYLTKDVIAAVDKNLRTITTAKGRAVGGLSMGGFCALNLGLKHPDLYSAVVSLSGETSPQTDTLPGGIQALFGADWQAKADANDPSKYVTTLDGSKGPAIYLGCGTGDPTILAEMQALLPKLKSRGFAAELHTLPGAHEYGYWSSALKESYPWAVKQLSPAS